MRFSSRARARMISVSKSKPSDSYAQLDVGQGVDAVGAVAAVPLAEVEPGQAVLEGGEHPVAEVLVRRHAAAPRRTLLEHPRAEHRVGGTRAQRLDDVLDALRGVLPVTVQQDHDVQPVLHRPGIAGLLVAAVAEVPLVPDDRERQGRLARERQADVVGVVGARVVADQDALHAVGEGLREPRQGAGERRARVVGDHEDADARSVVRRWRAGHRRGPSVGTAVGYWQVRSRGQARV